MDDKTVSPEMVYNHYKVGAWWSGASCNRETFSLYNMEAFMKYSGKKIGIGVGIAAVAVVAVVALTGEKTHSFADKYAGVDLSVDVEGMERTGTYGPQETERFMDTGIWRQLQ